MENINVSPYKGCGQITREQFLFYEMRTTARLMEEGLEDSEVIERIIQENLFQYPTEKSIRQMARICIARLKGLDDPDLVTAIVQQPSDVAKQICLYSMMRQYRLVWDFMVTVIGEKYRSLTALLERWTRMCSLCGCRSRMIMWPDGVSQQ